MKRPERPPWLEHENTGEMRNENGEIKQEAEKGSDDNERLSLISHFSFPLSILNYQFSIRLWHAD